MPNKVTQEIFAAGTWNGFPFTVNDLKKMAASFKQLSEYLQVPLKLGHNDEQAVTDGQPALGWVTDMYVDENKQPAKLIAQFEDIPDLVYNAFQKKLYRNVSIELAYDVEHKGTFYDYVVTAVALLGSDLPAVNVLNDLASYMSRSRNHDRSGYAAGRHVSFSVIKGTKEESNMPKTVEELEALLAKSKAENATLQANFTTLKTESDSATAKFQAQIDEMKAAAKKADVDKARGLYTKILEDAVSAKVITPAQRETFSKVLRIDDDDAVLSLSEEDVRGMFTTDGKPGQFNRDASHDQHDEETSENPSATLTEMAHKYMAEKGERDFHKAAFAVMRAHPQLASEFVMSNGEVQ